MKTMYFDIETVREINGGQNEEMLVEKYDKDFNFMPEFNSILTITVGMRVSGNPEPYVRNLIGGEKEQIEEFFRITKDFAVCGWNIKGFDLPFILRRALKHEIRIPDHFKLYGKKPWEMENVVDLKDVYRHMGQRAASLGDVCDFLWIPTPKDGIDGSQVQEFHDAGKDDEIRAYCKKDVEATLLVAERMAACWYM